MVGLRPATSSAVLGQFFGDGLLMRQFAPRVTVPVFFIQQKDDQLHSIELTQRLFDLIGSEQKLLRSSVGNHTDVPKSVLFDSVTWLSEQLKHSAR